MTKFSFLQEPAFHLQWPVLKSCSQKSCPHKQCTLLLGCE